MTDETVPRNEPDRIATRTLSGHLIRGAVGVALMVVAISQQHPQPGWSMLAGLLSLVALRGCPACWTIGLVEALHQRTGLLKQSLRQGCVPDAESPPRPVKFERLTTGRWRA